MTICLTLFCYQSITSEATKADYKYQLQITGICNHIKYDTFVEIEQEQFQLQTTNPIGMQPYSDS